MKKSFLFLAIVTLVFVSCSKDDDDGIGNFDYDVELLYGTWKFTHVEGVPWEYVATSATFYSDGTYSGKGYFGTGKGTYKLSGKRVTCYVDGERFMWYDVVSLEGIEATLIASDDSGSITVRCQKQ